MKAIYRVTILLVFLAGCAAKPDLNTYKEAFTKQDFETLTEQHNVGFSPNSAMDRKGNTALHLAALSGNFRLVEFLLESNADLSKKNASGQTPLHAAVQGKSIRIINLLSSQKANPYATDNQGISPIDLALQGSSGLKTWADSQINNGQARFDAIVSMISQEAIVSAMYQEEASKVIKKELDKQDIYINGTDSDGWTLLMNAVNQGKLAMVDLLLTYKSNVNAKDSSGWTALHLTADKNNLEGDALQAQIAQRLVRAGADLNAQNNEGVSPLYYTVWNQRPLTTQALLAAGADVNLEKGDGWTPLMLAVDLGDLPMVEQLLATEVNVNAKGPGGWTALHFTANKNNQGGDALQAQIAHRLIHAGAKLNMQSFDGVSPLYLSVDNQRPLTTQALLVAGADVNLATNSGITPLMKAVNQGDLPMVERLLAAKPNVNAKDSTGWTALHLTANQSNQGGDALQAQIAQKLIRAGTDLNTQKDNGASPLYVAVSNQRPLTTQVLLAAGADVNLAQNDDWTPLMEAVNQGDLAMVERLLAANPKLNVKTSKGWTALHFTANEFNREGDALQAQIAQRLVSAGTALNTKNNDGASPLYLSVWNQRPLTTQALLAAGADVNLAKNDGWTPLMKAVDQGDLPMVERLLAAKPNVNTKDSTGWTALHLTANKSNQGGDALQAQIARRLIKAGANPNLLNNDLLPPLGIAAVNNRIEVGKVLLKHNPDLNQKDRWGDTPEDSAREKGHFAFVALLLEHQSTSRARPTAQQNNRYPAPPAPQSGYTTCRTQCYNGDCYRTYSDGRKVHFQAPQKFNPITSQFEWDSGGC